MNQTIEWGAHRAPLDFETLLETKAAFAAAKARGVKLGGQRGSLDRMGRMARKGNAASALVRRAASAKRNEDLLPVIEDIRVAGLSTPQQIAEGLNERGITAARGGAWSAVQVRRVLKDSTVQKADAQRVTQENQKTIAA